MDPKELLELLPIINALGRPALAELTKLSCSDEAGAFLDATADAHSRIYHRLIANGLPSDAAVAIMVNQKKKLSESLKKNTQKSWSESA